MSFDDCDGRFKMDNQYHDKAVKRIQSSMESSKHMAFPTLLEEISLDHQSDWFPSEPYEVIIDGNPFCANIKLRKENIHFHLVAGYREGEENPGQRGFFSKLFKHLIISKKKVKAFKTEKGVIFIVNTDFSDWERFYRLGETEKKHFWKRGGRKKHVKPWDAYDWYVDWLIDKNKKRLESLGRSNYLKTRSEGEEMVAKTLQKLGIRYIPEYVIDWLEEDTASYRIADFYLPREDIYIEFNGGWTKENPEKRNEERKRYELKRKVYKKNNLKVIYLYSEDLSKIKFKISEGISKIIGGEETYGAPTDLKQAEEIIELREKIRSLEEKRLLKRIRKLLRKS